MTDRRFGKFKYGDGTLFGPSDDNGALAWDVSFDWDGNGTFDANEAAYLQGIKITRGRTILLKKNGQGFEPYRTGTATVTLSNHNKRFDAWNAESPLYPTVGYGVECRIRVRPMSGSTVYRLLRGRVTNIVPSGYGSKPKVQFTVSDGLDYLRNTPAGFSLDTDITPDEAIARILDAAKWTSGRNLLPANETIPYAWATDKRMAMAVIEEYANSFLGYFYCNANNDACFVPRSYVSSLLAEFSQDYLLKDIGNPLPGDISRNVTRLKVHPRQQSGTTTLWQTVGQPYEVLTGAANARVIFCAYSYNNSNVPAINVALDAFEANTLDNFSGTDLTSSCTTTIENLGESTKVTIVNNSGSTAHCRFNVVGNAIYETYISDITYPEDVNTVTDPRELTFDLKWLQDPNIGRDIVAVMGAFFAGLHPMPQIKLENRFDLQFIADLTDIVIADLPKLGVTGQSYRVGGIEHQSLTENCQGMLTTLYLEPYVAAGEYMQWDTNAVWDTSTVYGW